MEYRLLIHSAKRRKWWSPALFPFSTMFSSIPRKHINCLASFFSSANTPNPDNSKKKNCRLEKSYLSDE